MAAPSTTPARDYAAIAEQYARDVITGATPACEWVKLASKRHFDDLAKPASPAWPYTFDARKAHRFCRFVELLPHVQGPSAKTVFVNGSYITPTILLEPWQCFALCSIFGWTERDTGLRRFRKALVVIPARNGKTTIAAAVALYLLAIDGEVGAQVVCAALNREQARLVWDVAKQMVIKTPGLQNRFGVQALSHSIVVSNTASSFKPVSRDARSIEGVNASGVIIDELAANDSREVFDVLDERTGSRAQPLTFIISTEGDNPVGVFAEQVEYLQQVLDHRHSDDTYWGVYYSCPKELDWTSPEAWRASNPNYGVSVYEADMTSRCRRAMKNPASASSFKTKRLNIRVGAGEAFFNMLAWRDLCCDPALSIEDFEGKPCIIGLDLASKHDIAAKIYLFRTGGKYAVFGRFYYPEDRIDKDNPNYKIYRGWADSDRLVLTPGNVLDFEYIEEDLLEDRKLFKVLEVAYDPDQATELSTRMQKEKLTMVEVPQRWRQLSEPMKLMASLIDEGKLRHDGDPVLTWMVGNVFAKTNIKEDVYPRKVRPENKIDGAVAAMFALNRSIVMVGPQQSVYERRGMRFL